MAISRKPSWDVSSRVGPSVDVRYVWNANYGGIRFPREPTVVLSIDADEQAGVYWRATTLDAFTNDHWDEDLYALYSEVPENPVTLTDDPLEVRDVLMRAAHRQARA